MPEKFLKTAIDWDGVIVPKKGKGDPRNWLKMGLRPHDGVQAGIAMIAVQPDVEIMGIYTARPGWYRGAQTEWQRNRFGIPVGDIHHVKGHYAAKVGEVLRDAADPESREEPQLEPLPDLSRVVLIDDALPKILTSVEELRENPRFRAMTDMLTIVAFGPQQDEIETGTIYPDSNLQVVSLPDWSAKNVTRMLTEVRDHVA